MSEQIQFLEKLKASIKVVKQTMQKLTPNSMNDERTVRRQQIREPKYKCTPVIEHIRNCAKNLDPNCK